MEPIVPSRIQALFAAALLLIPVSEFAIALVQRAVSLLVRPQRLPRLELLGGVPEDARTMVVIPTLITTVEGVAHLIDHLEVVAIANRDPNIHFAILSDFADAEAADVPGDRELLDAAREAITRLNARMGSEPSTPLRPSRGHASCSCIAGACGTSANRSGWDGSASAASWKSSIACSAVRPIPASPRRSAPPTRSPGSATSSRSIPTRSCRAIRRAS